MAILSNQVEFTLFFSNLNLDIHRLLEIFL